MAYGPIFAVFLTLARIFTRMAEAADADAGMRLLRAAASAIFRSYAVCAQPAAPSTRATDKAARRFSSLSTRTMSRSRRRSLPQAQA